MTATQRIRRAESVAHAIGTIAALAVLVVVVLAAGQMGDQQAWLVLPAFALAAIIGWAAGRAAHGCLLN